MCVCSISESLCMCSRERVSIHNPCNLSTTRVTTVFESHLYIQTRHQKCMCLCQGQKASLSLPMPQHLASLASHISERIARLALSYIQPSDDCCAQEYSVKTALPSFCPFFFLCVVSV